MNPYEKLFPADRVQPHIRLQQKLYRCVPQLSQAMAAVAAFIVDHRFVQPRITEIAVTAKIRKSRSSLQTLHPRAIVRSRLGVPPVAVQANSGRWQRRR